MNYCDCCGDPISDGIEIEWVEPLGASFDPWAFCSDECRSEFIEDRAIERSQFADDMRKLMMSL